MSPRTGRSSLLIFSVLFITAVSCLAESNAPAGYRDLVALFEEWRAFERPANLDGAPDYTASAMAKRHEELASHRATRIEPTVAFRAE